MFDIDIDVGDRTKVLEKIKYITASRNTDNGLVPHTTGIFVQPIPHNPITGISNIDYHVAEELEYVKLDILNMSIYSMIKDEAQLKWLIATEPQWDQFLNKSITKRLVHLANHHRLIEKYPPGSLGDVAILLALIRPGKKHLVGKSCDYIKQHVWTRSSGDEYVFKKSHAVSYSQLVCVHLNLLVHFPDQLQNPSLGSSVS